MDEFRHSDAVGALPAVPPQSAFHCVDVGDDDRVAGITTLQEMPPWENGGYSVLRPEIFDHLPRNGDLIMDAFWQPADTVKERHALEASYAAGNRPWMLWRQNGAGWRR